MVTNDKYEGLLGHILILKSVLSSVYSDLIYSLMIKLFEQYNEYSKVKDWLDKMNIKNYTINDDLTVDVDGNVGLYKAYISEIPIQFGKVSGHFECSGNGKLSSLIGSPKYVGGFFGCSDNSISTLEGGPEHVGEFYNCNFNNITTLVYAPKYLGKDFLCKINPLPQELLSILGTGAIGNYAINKLIIKNQDEYGIWNSDGTLNKGRWDIFLKDYKDGILN